MRARSESRTPTAASRDGADHAQSSPVAPASIVDQRPATARLAQLTALADQHSSRNRTGLPDTLKSGIELLSGVSMDRVRVHRNSPKPAQLNAHAYAQGHDIHLAPGQGAHLPHEAWHVAQQAQGRVTPTGRVNGVAVNADASLEREADRKGAEALRVGAVTSASQPSASHGLVAPATGVPQRVADMKARGTQKRNLKSVRKQLTDAVDARGNGQATPAEIAAHDRAQNAGAHHAVRVVTLNQLIGDLNDTLENLTDLNLHDSDALGVEQKAGRGDGAAATQLASKPEKKKPTK